ncbi:MAG: aminotransferase class I/II-fold pyridoxal phosphate-dependent enzyme [Pseudomonadota bacterium]|nr:aminotransferase class I/II-fold pyridoxal phosphate-dependent enzyme [Pseudomonadota bacterium]
MPSARNPASPPRFAASPFERLRALLADVEPGMAPIDMSVGEPRHPFPSAVLDSIVEQADEFRKYPPIRGTDELRLAIADWMTRRYPALKGQVEPGRHILPLAGTREGLFSAVIAAVKLHKPKADAAVLIPNPFYQAYAAGAFAAGAEPVYMPADTRSGYLPALDALDGKQLSRASVIFVCSPSNPQGAVADRAYLERAIGLAREHDIMLFADECYSEIYTRTPPAGALETAVATGSFGNVVAFQSLSKRSNVAGLRSGFCAGDEAFINVFGSFRNVAAAQVPLPVQHASAALWRDETHVVLSQALYDAKFEVADRVLGSSFGYSRPGGGFFLWLDVSASGGDKMVTKTLWKDCGVKVVPGSYLAQEQAGGGNPGAGHIRVALVDGKEAVEEALKRIVGALGRG